jgi:hypothetical protein
MVDREADDNASDKELHVADKAFFGSSLDAIDVNRSILLDIILPE